MYNKIISEAHEHMENLVKAGKSHGFADAKAAHDWAEKQCFGKANKMKLKLVPLVAMIRPHMTRLQIEFAEDALEAFRRKTAMLHNPADKEEIERWLDKVDAELEACAAKEAAIGTKTYSAV